MAPHVVLSVILHGLFLVALPLAMKWFVKPHTFVPPRTFQVVRFTPPRSRASAYAPPVAAPAAPRPVEPKPAPKPAQPPKAKPAAKPRQSEPEPRPQTPREEDLSELEELLGAIGPPRVEYAAPSDFKYNWYLNAIMNKVEQYWKPPFEDRAAFVEVTFTILRNGAISDPAVKRPSGNATLDNLAVRAVKLAAPFGELPVGWAGGSLNVKYTLRPTRK